MAKLHAHSAHNWKNHPEAERPGLLVASLTKRYPPGRVSENSVVSVIYLQETPMTHEEAVALKSFKNYCNCGGHAWQINGRPQAQPHMEWCPQRQEYAQWWSALHG